ncbi:hypothetical protein BJ875DRAFT_524495 [Amylocarpus encephaloides]|uniref:Ankyrin repeat protein n=1 Tax=Amylocarpus encephaloides TaxID=45428 RepID=A0A9P7YNW1_9HELO|nr:hypothetical protein BJ875DRAFT_524495 [Amylocarpus encephaloides]
MSQIEIPKLPTASVKDFIPYLSKHPDTPIEDLIEPYKTFESELRKVYAQEPTHESVKDPNVNLVPIYDGHQVDVKIRARCLDKESPETKSHYIMQLDKERKNSGTPAVVPNFKDFQQNFNLFSESSLIDLDWSNVVAAGSSVTTALLPVPDKWSGSKRSMREYYHEHLAPASDVDLFLYGMNEEQALEKIKQIERRIKDSILHEVTTIRTKNAITIASQHPTRHVQIVLRLYDSISQIITGFDVDCACAAYDGKQVYAAPRALGAFITQCNTIDLTRRSPSYENRLSKYSRRGFEVHWPMLDRTRIDPTIFERSFGRTQGLARLLILEKLPKSSDRDSYMDQRRQERGRPALSRWRYNNRNANNLKETEEEEVADWIDQEEVSSYHSMTVPYGPKYHASKINRLLYAKDLLLNAEWNLPGDREVYLHRHPCFFGSAEEVLQDCCGYCPTPKTDEEIEVAEEEAKTNISGALKFIKDDPGRQEIGSFNPITDDEWTTMAYVGDTARLCQAIVDDDLEHVQDWCDQEDVDVNCRDYTGRTPLHLATMSSSPEIVQCLIDHGARLIARLVDGRTALHIAAARGNGQMVKAIMDKSLENEQEEEEKKETRRAAKRAERKELAQVESNTDDDDTVSDPGSEPSEITLESEESDTMTMGSFVKVKEEADGVLEDSTDDPDICDIDVIAWDYGLSPLHLAILNGHVDIIDLLVSEYGSDVLLPVKLVDPTTKDARGAILSIVLATFLPNDKAKKVVEMLLKLGATSAQADMNHITAFHYLVSKGDSDLVDILLANDKPVALSVLNRTGYVGQWNSKFSSPLLSAIDGGYEDMVSKLLEVGASPEIKFDDWIKSYLETNPWAKTRSSEDNMWSYRCEVTQPIIAAANGRMSTAVNNMVAKGADVATLSGQAYQLLKDRHNNYRYYTGESLLDTVQKQSKELRDYLARESHQNSSQVPEKLEDEDIYTKAFPKGSYKHWSALCDFQARKKENDQEWKNYNKSLEKKEPVSEGLEEKRAAISEVICALEKTEESLIEAGAKKFYDMHPKIEQSHQSLGYQYTPPVPKPYMTNFHFNLPYMDDNRKKGYIKLFEAAWVGDLETIKSLTLAPWPSGMTSGTNPPLQIAVNDNNGFNPFSIAVLRGHKGLAKKIVDICIAQYHEGDKTHRQRWNMITEDSDNENDPDDENVLPIFSELVSDKFTVDNLGEVSNIVKSNVMPLEMIEWGCKASRFLEDDRRTTAHVGLLWYAVNVNDIDLLKFVIEVGTEQKRLLAEEIDDQRCYTIPSDVFRLAIENGRTAMLAEMIKLTGVGIPLNALIQKSGVEIKTKPKYYQGLSVGGKKRADWAQAPDTEVRVAEERIPPLLQAAHMGSIDSLEWFMSDAPMRRYKEFAEENMNDKRIKTLSETGKGFDKTIGTWLSTRSELALHCAILWSPDEKGEKETKLYFNLIKHILAVTPETLEQKSGEGYTPLQVAILNGRPDVATFLISQGANQRHRDKTGRNMVHCIIGLCNSRTNYLHKFMAPFDKEAVKEMFLERCTWSPGALTPLGLYMNKYCNAYCMKFVKALAGYSTGEDLSMINGEGDLPVHVAIKNNYSSITGLILNIQPSHLYRENTTGRTPLEMARERYQTSCVENPISLLHNQSGNYEFLNRPSKQFLPTYQKGNGESRKRTFEICEAIDCENVKDGVDRKRRLVSLFEANEVAKRVDGRSSRHGGNQMVVNGGIVERQGTRDVVSEWL